jgi:hypothetical protein
MARISPKITLFFVLFVLVSQFSLGSFAQSSTGATPTQPQAGPRVQLEGELQIQFQDFKDHSRVSYTLKLPNGKTVPLQFMKNPPTRFLTGDHVRVDGQMSGDNLVLYSGNTSVTKSSKTSSGGSTTPAIPVPYTFGPQSTLVILVNFQDNAIQPYTVSDVQSIFSGPVNDYFVENSYGQTSIVPTVVGWYTIPDSVTTCNSAQMATDAQNAAVAAGVTLANYTRYVYLFPTDNACQFSGMSQVGGNPSQSWINGTLAPYVVNHELGHAFGLWHAHLFDCGTSATICSSPNIVEYGDPVDVMGIAQTASADYNAFQKERLGWLNYGASPSIQTVTSSGTYTIYPYEVGGRGPNALKVLKSTDSTTGAKTWYYLEQRQAIGFDAFLADTFSYTQNETTGVLFHLGTDGNGNSSDLLDMTPASPTLTGWLDMSLVGGQNYQDSTAGVTFTPTAVSSAGATIQITMNGSSCTPANPTISVTPSQSQSVTPGTGVNFTATVTDNDSSGCSSAIFSLADVLPSGWAGAWNASSLSLSPGKSGSATLTVTSPAGAAGGLYTVGINASNAAATSDSGSATATYAVATSGPLSVSVSTNQSSYLPGQTVKIAVTVLSGTLPSAGASVTATIKAPNGKLTTLNGTTGSAGTASLSFRLSKGAPAGTYQIGATATSTTSTSSPTTATAVANASFTVE